MLHANSNASMAFPVKALLGCRAGPRGGNALDRRRGAGARTATRRGAGSGGGTLLPASATAGGAGARTWRGAGTGDRDGSAGRQGDRRPAPLAPVPSVVGAARRAGASSRSLCCIFCSVKSCFFGDRRQTREIFSDAKSRKLWSSNKKNPAQLDEA